jgi:metallo-beta-lactamase family protein
MLHRRAFLRHSAALAPGLLLGGSAAAQAPKTARRPRLTFYGSTRQVSGSCHLLETSEGLFVVDCGLFISDIDDPDKENRELPFDPREVKALFLTHAHADHNGRLALLTEKGFRGPIYCTDATRDLTQTVLESSAGGPREDDDKEPLYSPASADGMLGQLRAVPYNTRVEKHGLTFRYTDAGHLLGSAMVEVWADGTKILFGGDMGPDHTPVLCKPTQHFGADVVLVESTYGPVPRDVVSFSDFGRRVMKVIQGGGSVLLPAFALHKTQTILYVLNTLQREGVIDKRVRIISDSSTAQKGTELYRRYREYHDAEAKKLKEPFYPDGYREMRSADSLATHGKEPAIYVSTSGMLDHATAPKHLVRMAGDPKNAVFIVGYQAPRSVGAKLAKGDKEIDVPLEEIGPDGVKRELKKTEIKLQVEKVSGFSSHARGGQILDWLARFQSVGDVYVVHGDGERSTGLAEAIKAMGVNAHAPKRGESFDVGTTRRVKPGRPPALKPAGGVVDPAPVDK